MRSLRRLCAGIVLTTLTTLVASCAHKPPQFDPAARRTCLVLSVGGPRGVAHLGAIAAVRARGIKIDCVVGNSMGSLVGALYASSPGEDTEARFRRFSTAYVDETKADVLRNGAVGAAIGSVLGFVVGKVAGDEHGKMAAAAGAAIGASAGAVIGGQQTAKLDRDRLVRVMDSLVGGARIETLPVAYATTYQQRAGDGLDVVVASRGNLAEAVGRSIANPYIFSNLDVIKAGQVDPGADRASMTPVDEACRLFPDANLLAINVTGQPAFYRAEMKCPLREVRVDPGPLDAEAVFRLQDDFTRAVKAGYDATAKAL